MGDHDRSTAPADSAHAARPPRPRGEEREQDRRQSQSRARRDARGGRPLLGARWDEVCDAADVRRTAAAERRGACDRMAGAGVAAGASRPAPLRSGRAEAVASCEAPPAGGYARDRHALPGRRSRRAAARPVAAAAGRRQCRRGRTGGAAAVAGVRRRGRRGAVRLAATAGCGRRAARSRRSRTASARRGGGAAAAGAGDARRPAGSRPARPARGCGHGGASTGRKPSGSTIALLLRRDADAEVHVRRRHSGVDARPDRARPCRPRPSGRVSTAIAPRCVSSRRARRGVSIVTTMPFAGTVPAKRTTPATGASTERPQRPPMSTPRCWPACVRDRRAEARRAGARPAARPRPAGAARGTIRHEQPDRNEPPHQRQSIPPLLSELTNSQSTVASGVRCCQFAYSEPR